MQVLEAQMLPATAPFYMGLAAGWAVFLSNYIQHTGAYLVVVLLLITCFAGVGPILGYALCYSDA